MEIFRTDFETIGWVGAKRFIPMLPYFVGKSLKVGYWFYHRVIWESLLPANFLDPSD